MDQQQGVLNIILNCIMHLVDMVPSNFWSIILGATFTLMGIHLTNRANDKRLRQQLKQDRELKEVQLEHDRNLKNHEREMALRKDIFLAATEAIHAGLITMNRMADLDIPQTKLGDDFLPKASSLSKVHLVATERSIEALLLFSGEFGVTFQRLAAQRLQLLVKKNEIDIQKTLLDSFVTEQGRVHELTKQHNLDGSQDTHRLEELNRRFEFESNRIVETSNKIRELATELYAELLPFSEEITKQNLRLWRLSVPVIVFARKELNLPLDEGVYATLVEAAIQKHMATLDEIRRQMQRLNEDVPPTE